MTEQVPEWGAGSQPPQTPLAARREGRPTVSPTIAKALVAVGAVASLFSTFLAWTWTASFPGNLSVSGYPGGNQLITLVVSVVLILALGPAYGVPGLRWLAPRGYVRLLRGLALANAVSTWYVLLAIAIELNGLANWVSGSWTAAIATLLPVAGSFLLPDDQRDAPPARPIPLWAQSAIILVAIVLVMFVADYGITTTFTEEFLGFALAVGFAAWGLNSSGMLARLTDLTSRNRIATSVAAFVAALLFVFLQTSDQYNTIADDILIFATVALGLNIVVGLAGLLDLGYVAFLGVGAYSAALVSGALSSRYAHTVLPFWGQILIGVSVSIIAGVIIGAPTLRLRG
ncbi:ABC transporter permease subunit, partial [Actinocrinis sp.]|uniref:ABC transporter permease subunit n=1 Tax=Actinocrinis sp. TaxID=1920516 RepID=UPI002D58662C|nr:hypothetical protein [Actinocrinis sp.]